MGDGDMPENEASKPASGQEEIERLNAELERLRRENEMLAQQAAAPDPAVVAAHRGRVRTGWALALVVVAVVVLALAIPAVWVNRVFLDTDNWVATVAPLAENPDIQNAVAKSASDAIIERLDAQTLIKQYLPEQLAPLAPVIANSVNSFVTEQSYAIVRSDQFAKLWEDLNRVGHKALITAVTGRDGIVSVQNGTFTLDVGLLVDEVVNRLEDRGLGFLSKLPTGNINKTVTLYESPLLAQLGPVVDAISAAALWIPLVGLALVGGAFALATDRRRVALWLGVGIVVAAMLPLQSIYLGQSYVVQQVQANGPFTGSAAQAAFDIIFRGLVQAEQVFTTLGIVIWLGALFAGPSRWAVALRTGMQGGLAGAASHLEFGRFGDWVAARASGLRYTGVGLGVAILLALPAPRTISEIVWVAVFVVVWFVVVEFVAAGGRAHELAAQAAATIAAQGEAGNAEETDGDRAAEPSDETAAREAAAAEQDSADDKAGGSA